ncbi:MAG: 1-acyl-sn-glycerol-3-phosphate acyltransferase [Clostridia bacterium]|nr:1-acyl-sn-glycerol-3-phosphate acyltransferase [Clostridia bacterium]
MILGENRPAVIENIRQALRDEDYYRKVELGDPVLDAAQEKEITDRFLACRKKPIFRLKSFFARRIAGIGTRIINRNTEIVGEVDQKIFSQGVVITSNHFSPIENTIIRHYVKKQGAGRLHIVSQVTNFAMTGIIGFLMNYTDTVPLSKNMRYLTGDLIEVLREFLNKNHTVLIYPEQEMWFNYRKPRPLKRGAYYFAAKLNRPIVSCFVEILQLPEMEMPEFHKVSYRLHVLGVIEPDVQKTVKENSEEMCRKDYELKKAAYEQAYHKPLVYDFATEDIAGWEPNE